MPGSWGRDQFWLETPFLDALLARNAHKSNFSGHGALNSSSLSMFSGETGVIRVKVKQC